jgi:transglutaminase-like putative cysteine protease
MLERWESRTGFTDSVRFGRVTKLMRSRAVVMRVRGPEVTHLRGVVLDSYQDERWFRSERDEPHAIDLPDAKPVGEDVVEVKLVQTEETHLFVPLGTRDLASKARGAELDRMGTLRRLPSDRAPVLWFRVAPHDGSSPLEVAPPSSSDLQIPRSLQPAITELAQRWTQGTKTRAEALSSIERHFSAEFTYSIDYRARTHLDAVAEFLFVSRVGHCESFASGMVLLARSLGIPARMVVGYRVGERNPFYEHRVVRQSNAHAWVETADESGVWTTRDPTPMSELPQDLAHDEEGLDAFTETAAATFSRLEDWLAERTVGELGAVALIGLAAFATIRWRRQRQRAIRTVERTRARDHETRAT